MENRATRIGLVIWTTLVVLFLWIPLVLIMIYAFNASNVQSWPITSFTTKWFSVAWNSPDVRSAIWLSVRAAADRHVGARSCSARWRRSRSRGSASSGANR